MGDSLDLTHGVGSAESSLHSHSVPSEHSQEGSAHGHDGMKIEKHAVESESFLETSESHAHHLQHPLHSHDVQHMHSVELEHIENLFDHVRYHLHREPSDSEETMEGEHSDYEHEPYSVVLDRPVIYEVAREESSEHRRHKHEIDFFPEDDEKSTSMDVALVYGLKLCYQIYKLVLDQLLQLSIVVDSESLNWIVDGIRQAVPELQEHWDAIYQLIIQEKV